MKEDVLRLILFVIVLTVTGKSMRGEEEKYEFPDTLEGFGLKFNEEGQLRDIETDEPFTQEVRKGDYNYNSKRYSAIEDGQLRQIDSDEPFEFEERKDDHKYNQKRYNALGDVITEYIYKIMEKQYKLQRAYMPPDKEEIEPQTFVFISGDLYTNEDKLLVLIHGSGAVRAGQWARRLIINDSLDKGSQLPYIKWARENGYAIIVANTNINAVEMPVKGKKKKEPVKIRGNSTPEEHLESLWHEFVQRSRAKHVAIVAHSFGGICTLHLAMRHIREFEERVFAIAFTDSVHNYKQQQATEEVKEFYRERAMNWASAYDGLDAPLQTEPGDCPTVSAGTERHEYTSYSAMQSIFTWLKEKYDQRDPAKKRVSMGEPQNAHYHRPTSSEAQHLVSRTRGVGEESPERPDKQPANQNPSTEEVDVSVEQPVEQAANQKVDDLMSFDEEAVKTESSAVQLEKELLNKEDNQSSESTAGKEKAEL